MKKGLRLLEDRDCIQDRHSNRRPDEEGIKTKDVCVIADTDGFQPQT